MPHASDPSSRTSAVDLAGVANLLLRVTAGGILAAHGWQKVFLNGIGSVTGNFEKMGVPLHTVTGPAVSILEFAGGISLALGLFTRPVAFLLALNMLGAIVLVHWPAGLFGPAGFEFPMILGVTALFFAARGAGVYSIDEALAGRRDGQ